MAARLNHLILEPAQKMTLPGCKQLHMLAQSPGAATMQGSLLVIIALLLLLITSSLAALLAPAMRQQLFSLAVPTPTISSAGGMSTAATVQSREVQASLIGVMLKHAHEVKIGGELAE